MRLSVNPDEVEGVEKNAKDILERLNTPHFTEADKFYRENKEDILEFIRLYYFLQKIGVTSDMYDTMKMYQYFICLSEDRKKKETNEYVCIMIGTKSHTISYDELKIEDSGIFWIDYYLKTTTRDRNDYKEALGAYDVNEDSYVSFRHELKFTDKKQRKQFLEDFKAKRVSKIKLSKDKNDQYLVHYINK